MQEKGRPRRPFATGSKPGPDAVDHYLEGQGFYRKHVARDASSLFRVVSEQIFDVQNFYEKIRQDCAAYMEARPKEYANEVDKNFYNYVSNLRRNRTHGSLLELRVMARLYRKNVILFEPTQNLQTNHHVYVQDDAYNKDEPLRVFYSHKDKHFDVIYTMAYVERLAECQSIVYSVLYQNVFKLPDVQYAVERMLHDQEEHMTLPLPNDPSKYKTQSGEIVQFDSHLVTDCVLKDPKTCHFHNQIDFEAVVNENKDAITVINRTDEPGRLKIFKPIDGFLHDMDKSCVRQLLDERITPFPYKVAKALDPSIYRNTEFELWSENRKEQRLKWLDSAEFPMKQHIDDKWFVYDYDKYRRNGMRKMIDCKYEQAVVDESSYMALDDEMKKKYVILNPSAEPFKLHHFTGLEHFIPSKDSLNLTVMPANVNYGRGGGYRKRGGGRYNYNNNGYHQQQNSRPEQAFNQNSQQITHVSEIEREATYQYQEPQEQPGYYNQQQQENSCVYENQSQQVPTTHVYQQQPHQSWNNQMIPFIPQPTQYQIQAQPIQLPTPLNYQNVMPYGNFSIPPPSAQQAVPLGDSAFVDGGDSLNIVRETELNSATIDWKATESIDPNGVDLPMSDVSTLQFYYNLGVRYFFASGVKRRLDNVVTQLESISLNENPNESEKSHEQQATSSSKSSSDPPPVPINTPVSTKPFGGNYGPPNPRFQNSGNNSSIRRPFPSNRDGIRDNYRGSWNNNNPRKEIKFNSNVKNVHKAESQKTGSSGHNVNNEKQAPVKPTATKSIQSQVFHATSGVHATTPSHVPAANQERTSPNGSIAQYSPISPIGQDSQLVYQQIPVQDNTMYQQQQYYQYPNTGAVQQSYLPTQQQQQPGVTMIYQMNDDLGYTMHQFPQTPIQYAPQFQYPQPVFYPMHQNFQQQFDGSLVSSNDSGYQIEQMHPPQGGFQQAMPYFPQYQAPVPIYYTQQSIPQTPQIGQVAPTFPTVQMQQIAPIQAQQAIVMPLPVATVAPTVMQGSNHLEEAEETATENVQNA